MIFLTGKENMDETIEIKVTSEMAGKRLDVVLSEQCSDLTRSYINKLCKEERAALNGKTSKGNKKCKEGDVITLQVPEPTELEILPEEMNLDIVYEDQDVILINKPKGMVVHPAAGHYSGTLVNGLMAHCKDDLSGINGVLRPGIVHRIDKDTTGILIVCKNDMAHQSIAKQLYDHSITRKYHAIVYGNIKEEEGTVNAPIGRSLKDRKKMGIVMDGKHAVTHYKVLKRLKKDFTYIECQLETGRTHQIRVHMASIKHPLLGDDVYGPKKSKYTLEGQCLHAKVLGFVHPRTGEYMEFEVIVSNPREEKTAKLKDEFGIITTTDNKEVAKQSDILVLSVKPQVYPAVIKEIRDEVSSEQIIVTIAAGVSMEAAERQFGKEVKIVRVMPNTPALVGEGMSGLCCNEYVTEEEFDLVHKIFESFGKAEKITENLMDAVVGVSGSGPAYVYMFIEAMADAAVAQGLPRKQAYTFAAQTLLGSAKMVLETGQHPGELKDAVCSPAGTTIEAVNVLEKKGMRSAVIEAVTAAAKKNHQLGKKKEK